MKHTLPVLLIALSLSACSAPVADKREQIELAIDEANYCENDADCVVVTGQCPFGCYVLTNEAEADRIDTMMSSYESDCVYSCLPVQPVSCKENKCVMDEYDPSPFDSGTDPSVAEDESQLPEGEFAMTEDGNFYGELYVSGYGVQTVIEDPFCDIDCEQFDYVSFYVTNVTNQQWADFFASRSERNAQGDTLLGLGCLFGGDISFANYSDELGGVERNRGAEFTAAIVNSSIEQPIAIKLTKLPETGGRGPPACFSYFLTAEVYDVAENIDDVVEYDQNSWQEMIDDSCLSFSDGCNTCRREPGSNIAACTRKACMRYEKPECLDEE